MEKINAMRGNTGSAVAQGTIDPRLQVIAAEAKGKAKAKSKSAPPTEEVPQESAPEAVETEATTSAEATPEVVEKGTEVRVEEKVEPKDRVVKDEEETGTKPRFSDVVKMVAFACTELMQVKGTSRQTAAGEVVAIGIAVLAAIAQHQVGFSIAISAVRACVAAALFAVAIHAQPDQHRVKLTVASAVACVLLFADLIQFSVKEPMVASSAKAAMATKISGSVTVFSCQSAICPLAQWVWHHL